MPERALPLSARERFHLAVSVSRFTAMLYLVMLLLGVLATGQWPPLVVWLPLALAFAGLALGWLYPRLRDTTVQDNVLRMATRTPKAVEAVELRFEGPKLACYVTLRGGQPFKVVRGQRAADFHARLVETGVTGRPKARRA